MVSHAIPLLRSIALYGLAAVLMVRVASLYLRGLVGGGRRHGP